MKRNMSGIALAFLVAFAAFFAQNLALARTAGSPASSSTSSTGKVTTFLPTTGQPDVNQIWLDSDVSGTTNKDTKYEPEELRFKNLYGMKVTLEMNGNTITKVSAAK